MKPTFVTRPEAIPAERLERYGARPPKLLQYPGLKEEYYLADFEPDPAVPAALGVDTARVVVVLRPPPDVSLYHRHSNPLFPQTLEHLGRHKEKTAATLGISLKTLYNRLKEYAADGDAVAAAVSGALDEAR